MRKLYICKESPTIFKYIRILYACIQGFRKYTFSFLSIPSEIPAGFGPGSVVPQPNTNALIHTSVELTCRPTGEPKPTIRWLFNGALNVKSNKRFRILPNGNLRISNVTKADSGYYICEASNRLGKAQRKGHLNVLGKV